MQAKIELIEHDDLYLAVYVPKFEIEKYLAEMQQFLPQTNFDNYLANQKSRDGDKYHITVVNPLEYKAEFHDNLIDKIINYSLIGLGRAIQDEDETFFIVTESPNINNLRQQVQLPDRDLHVTLGFKNNDIHNVRKDKGCLLY